MTDIRLLHMSAHYKNGHYKMAVLDDFSEMCMHAHLDEKWKI
jgi:hypothetical protein